MSKNALDNGAASPARHAGSKTAHVWQARRGSFRSVMSVARHDARRMPWREYRDRSGRAANTAVHSVRFRCRIHRSTDSCCDQVSRITPGCHPARVRSNDTTSRRASTQYSRAVTRLVPSHGMTRVSRCASCRMPHGLAWTSRVVMSLRLTRFEMCWPPAAKLITGPRS
jgi:hypothetical protein